MVLSRLTKITGPGVSTDTNWVGNNADFTGITTSGTSFNIGVTTIHSNLIEAHNIKSTGILTATGGSFSGNVTAVDGTFSGNVSIAGTLTYEDVTNIDSVGIITAPALDVDDFLDVGSNIKLGNAGVITATSFVGSGAALTGIDATAIKDSGGNVKIQAQASGAIHTGVSTFQDLTVEKSGNLNVNIKSTSGWGALEVGGATAGYIDIKKPFSADFDLRLMHDGSNSYITSADKPFSLYALGHRGILIDALGQTDLRYRDNVKLKTETGGISVIGVLTATSFVGDGSNLTGLSGVSVANQANNRLITATGTTDALNGEANLTFTGSILTVSNSSGASELTLVTPSANDSGVYFNDGSNAGALTYNHSDNSMRFRVNSTEKLRIKSDGRVGVGVDPSDTFHIKKNDAIGPTVTLENNANKAYINNWGSSGGGGGRANRFEINATSQAQASICAPYITFMTGGTGDSNEKVRITSGGKLCMGGSTGQYTLNNTSTDIIIGSGGSGRGITFHTSAYADNMTISFHANENLSRAEGEIKYGPPLTSTTNDRNAMMFRTNSAERLRITSNGRVGINSTSPQQALDVRGSINGGSENQPFQRFHDSHGDQRATKHYFRCTKGGTSIFDILTVDLNTNFHQALIILYYGARIQNGWDSVTFPVHKIIGVNRFNGGNIGFTKNTIVQDSTVSTHANIDAVATSSTQYRIRLTFSGTAGGSSFCGGFVEIIGLGPGTDGAFYSLAHGYGITR